MKTFQEKLQILEERIRKDLPRLMELKEGIILKSKVHHSLYADYVVLKIQRDDYSTYTEINGRHNGSFSIKNEDLLKVFEIVGHNILLSDVLEWLGKFFYFRINQEGIIYEEFVSYFQGELDRDYVEVGKIDFSKPYLKDQSKELIDFLYNLKNKQPNII